MLLQLQLGDADQRAEGAAAGRLAADVLLLLVPAAQIDLTVQAGDGRWLRTWGQDSASVRDSMGALPDHSTVVLQERQCRVDRERALRDPSHPDCGNVWD